MALDKVINFFKNFNFEDKILLFQKSSATVKLASEALGCEEARIAKTLSFDVNGQTILIVVAGDVKIDNSKYKHYFKTKAKMLSYDEVEMKVGHAVGGVCPFAVNDDVKVFLDVSLKRFSTVFPACGSSNSAIELTIPQLEHFSNYIDWLDVCKLI